MRGHESSTDASGHDHNLQLVGVVGLGRMGAGIAERLDSQGVGVLGYDVDPEKGKNLHCRCTNDPTQLARECGTLIFSLPRAQHLWPAIEAVGGTDGEALLAGTRIIDMGTSLPKVQRQVATILHGRGVDFVDAPVSGGPSGARNGTLLIMVGGPEAVVQQVRPILELAGRRVLHVGSLGSGTIVKLLNNGIVAATVLAVNEATALAQAHDIDAESFLSALGCGSARSYVADEVTAPHVAGKIHEPRFTYEQLLKDAKYLEIAMKGKASEYSIFGTAASALNDIVAAGFGGRDFGDVRPWDAS